MLVRLRASMIMLLGVSVGACTSIPLDPIEVGTRPSELISGLDNAALRDRLASCEAGPFKRTEFSISHRGAPLGYPEHTAEGYRAAAAMGAGLIECDVTFTADLDLVCRHSQCDLHSTTNILQTPLAKKCSEPFEPAAYGVDVSEAGTPARAKCCTSDLNTNEFLSLCARHDYIDPNAQDVDTYLANPPTRVSVDPVACGTLVTHAQSIELIDSLGADFVPELKAAQVPMPFKGLTYQAYASKLLTEYDAAGIAASRVHPQSFSIDVIRYWIDRHPEFAAGTVYLDPRARQPGFKPTLEGMLELKAAGITTLAPPMPLLLVLTDDGQLAPSEYAKNARLAGLDLITWTFEAGRATDPNNRFYANLPGWMDSESKMLEVLDALHNQVGVKGVFSDWPGTVTYYASCLGLD